MPITIKKGDKMETDKKEQIVYLHICFFCNKRWWTPNKVANCPKCSHQHIWFRGTSKIVDVKMEVQK